MHAVCLFVVCAVVAVTAQETPQSRYMRAHFKQAMSVHAAVIRGDLQAVAPAARPLADLDTASLPVAPPEHAAALISAARDATEARDILAAGLATARMFIACGNCHRAAGVRPEVTSQPAPAAGGIVGHMLEHQLAVDRLLQGLVIPSDSLWRAGARALVSAPMHPRELPVDSELRRQLAPTEERVHRLATDALQATDPLGRAAFYGQIVAGCADCHQHHAKLWGPPPGIR